MTGTTLDYHHDSPSLRIVDALAAVTDTDPLDLDPLYNVVDPEALDQIVNSDGDQVDHLSVQFVYDGHDVQVRGDGSIAVDGSVYAHGDN
ncbi:HalOD1 output domain-containing protein [Natronolimnobius baerhuensis]|uniref:Halobacterial output domain-containing protein n=1 Tax=Natronolimnobius baerhuensis TaxID=253108 RepID=A0A202E5V7_9EURY|nr:HalOD1 output domain-containing protein [Natronolimnobius baerhuensis]OVE83619.1 hypothetical protein B2G88_14400 [Natronolimnobius baerhuensis]